MSANYSIDQNTKTLVFTGNPQSLNEDSVKEKDRPSFTSVVIPNSVSNIEVWAFYKCSALASIHIPNSVSSIGGLAFEGCPSLASVHIPNSVSTIGGSTFGSCSALAFIHIPNSVLTIQNAVFMDCRHLHKVCIPTNLKIDIWFFTKSFKPQTSLLRPRLKPITSLSQKSALRASKATYSVYL